MIKNILKYLIKPKFEIEETVEFKSDLPMLQDYKLRGVVKKRKFHINEKINMKVHLTFRWRYNVIDEMGITHIGIPENLIEYPKEIIREKNIDLLLK